MRKRRIVWVACGAALLSLAMAGAMPDRAAAQSSGRPWLGVTTQEITDELRDGLDYQGSGVIVNRVSADSPAERAGIRKGDVIVSFNSRTIDSPAELSDVVRAARVGQSVSVTIVRDGSRRSLSARLAEWSDSFDEEMETPYPTPRARVAPRAPRAPSAPKAPKTPSAPRAYHFDWNGDLSDLDGLTMLRSMGRGRLGVQIQDLNAGLGEALGVPEGRGVLVMEVNEDTPAERAGMKAGDVITRVGDTKVDDVEDLRRALRDREGRVAITVVRRGASRTVEAELEGKDDVKLRSKMFRAPNARDRVLREHLDNNNSREDMEKELRDLREEMRELRLKMEAMDRK